MGKTTPQLGAAISNFRKIRFTDIGYNGVLNRNYGSRPGGWIYQRHLSKMLP